MTTNCTMCENDPESDRRTGRSTARETNADDNTSGIRRRKALKHVSVATTGFVGLSGMTASVAADRGFTQCSQGDWESGGSWDSIDVEIVDAANSYQYRNAYEKCVDGVCEGLSQLEDECYWFDGFRVTLTRTGKAYTGSNNKSAIEDFLDRQDLDEDVHYHVVYSSFDGSRHNVGGNAWDPNSRTVSAVSAASTSVHAPTMHVRGLHQMIHMYLDGQFIQEESGMDDLGNYDGAHALGTYDASEGCRSVMADRNEYIDKAESGTCSGDDPYWKSTAPQSVSDIYFSDCTKAVLRRSAYEAR